SDTGHGMSRHFIDTRLFRPFSTTKKTGIGLGLYTCREVIQASGGSIETDSVEGAGTTFRVVLPSSPHDRRN
ncbi:MAG TPA: ATP-binding protein, partial [Pyrinomonadaceae bacterium]